MQARAMRIGSQVAVCSLFFCKDTKKRTQTEEILPFLISKQQMRRVLRPQTEAFRPNGELLALQITWPGDGWMKRTQRTMSVTLPAGEPCPLRYRQAEQAAVEDQLDHTPCREEENVGQP